MGECSDKSKPAVPKGNKSWAESQRVYRERSKYSRQREQHVLRENCKGNAGSLGGLSI